jgi:putative methyltransferase
MSVKLIILLDLADRVVRTIPAEDLTNGFFVSCFVRKSSNEQREKRTAEESGNLDTISKNAAAKKKKKNNKKKKAALTV